MLHLPRQRCVKLYNYSNLQNCCQQATEGGAPTIPCRGWPLANPFVGNFDVCYRLKTVVHINAFLKRMLHSAEAGSVWQSLVR